VHEARTVVSPVWVSLEGVNGVGKTYLARALTEHLSDRARVLSELTDGGGDTVSAAVVSALSRGRSFLRTGHPLTETMALLALKVREHELVASLADPPQIVIEDRGVDTVAVYQAAVAAEPDNAATEEVLRDAADRVYAAAALWRPLPDLTLLIVDDLAACERRFAEREGRPVTEDEARIIGRAARLYRWRAGVETDRIRTVDRTGRVVADVLDTVVGLVETVVGVVENAGGAR
jgi:dTMP kinase